MSGPHVHGDQVPGMRCPWKVHFGVSQDATTQCDRESHADPDHEGPGPYFDYQRVSWQAGDRREYTGDWPGPCPVTPGCTLHLGHHGRCAP